MRWNCWNTNPIDVTTQPRAGRVIQRSDVLPGDPDRPRRRRSSTPSRPNIVDFPEPDGPTIDMNSPGHDLQRHLTQRVHLDLLAVDPGDRLEFEERLRCSGRRGTPVGRVSDAVAAHCGLIHFGDDRLTVLHALLIWMYEPSVSPVVTGTSVILPLWPDRSHERRRPRNRSALLRRSGTVKALLTC